MIGFSLLILAALGRIWCRIYISGRKDRELCTQGPYAMCRNPLYFFSFIGVIGFCLALQSVLMLVILTAAYIGYYRLVIDGEENRLSNFFLAGLRGLRWQHPAFFTYL
jgi:protein-S-isoprenylcysteine O-methyltransferase Ste14